MRLSSAAGLGFAILAVVAFSVVLRSSKELRELSLRRNAERMAVNAALCFLWPAVVLLLLQPQDASFGGSALLLTSLVVLWCLCLDVKAVASYVGPLEDYRPGESLRERSTQISTAAFAAGTFLLSKGGSKAPPCVTTVVFLALLLCVLSAVPSGVARLSLGDDATWEAAQRGGVSFAAGLLALAIAICVDYKIE